MNERVDFFDRDSPGDQMLRSRMTRVLMGGALAGILGMLCFSGRAGARFTLVESVSFSSDGASIAVATLNARDANTQLKRYKADVSRVVSLVDARHGERLGIIHQDFRPGNCGAAFRLWRAGRTSAVFNPITDRVMAHAFGGGEISHFDIRGVESDVTPAPYRTLNLEVSPSGRYFAASGEVEITVFNSRTNQVVRSIETYSMPFLSASLLSFSEDETRIIGAGQDGVLAWDIHSDAPASTVFDEGDPWINSIAGLSQNRVLVCSNEWISIHGFDGQLIAKIASGESLTSSVSFDRRTAAVACDESIHIIDLESLSIVRTLRVGWATALAFSPDGRSLAVGGPRARISLIDVESGSVKWAAKPAGRYRLPWTAPALLLFVWGAFAWRLSRGRLQADRHRDQRLSE